MNYAFAPILVGVTSPVSEILLLSKTAKIPFPTMDYSPWSSKNLINWNRLKKFMQVGANVKCMHTNFGGCSFNISCDTSLLLVLYSYYISSHILLCFFSIGLNSSCISTTIKATFLCNDSVFFNSFWSPSLLF